MKKATYTLTAIVFCMSTITASAQSWYARAGGGYSGQFAKTEFNNTDPNGITDIEPSTSVTVSADGSTASVEALNGTVGAGYKFFVTGGYMFNPNLGAELGLNYFRGDDVTVGELNSPQVESKA